MEKHTTPRRHAPRRHEPAVRFFPDPAGRRALTCYLRKGGAALPSGAPVVRALSRTETTIGFLCPYCAQAHSVSTDATPNTIAPCGVGRMLFVEAGTHTVGLANRWWSATLGPGHTMGRRDRYLAQLAHRLERLEDVAPPWTRTATRAIAAAVGVSQSQIRKDIEVGTECPPERVTGRDGNTYRPTLTVIRGGVGLRGARRGARGRRA